MPTQSERKIQQFVSEPARKIPIFSETDVVVVGGGPAGVAAAIAAARQGVDVILLERYGCLGGLATGGLVILLANLCDGKGRQLVKGIVQEIIDKLDEFNGCLYPRKEEWGSTSRSSIEFWKQWGATEGDHCVRYRVIVDAEILKYVMNSLIECSGVKLVLHAWGVKAIANTEKVEGVIFESKSGRQAIKAKITIDSTGDGDIFASAGAPFNEISLPLGLIFRVGGVETQKVKILKNINWEAIEEWPSSPVYNMPTRLEAHRTTKEGTVWFNNNILGNPLDVRSLTSIEVEIRKIIFKILEYCKRKVPGFKAAYLIDTASQIGVRASRQLIGEHIITMEELTKGEDFYDRICVLQPSLPHFSVNDPYKTIPYRSLIPKKIENLLVAGRCLSADIGAQNILRAIPYCMAMGQAAGTAAALAVTRNTSPRNIDIQCLQDTLRNNNVLLE